MSIKEEEESDLEVPEEPDYDYEDDSAIVDIAEIRTKVKFHRPDNKPRLASETDSRSSSALGFTTAVKIARWMARAYGYVSKKKHVYISQDKVTSLSIIKIDNIRLCD